MKVLLQRVSGASVAVAGETVGKIGPGLLLLVGFGAADTEAVIQPMLEKLVNLRVFADDAGKFQFSVLEIKGEILAIPQFTLYGDTQKGRRPDFSHSLRPDHAKLYFELFCSKLRLDTGLTVASGIFGAHMEVSLVNDGPVTLMLER